MTSQLHISKFEILSFSNKIYKNSNFLSLMWRDTLFWTEKALKYFVFMDFIEETKDFKFWNVDLGCHFCSSVLEKSHLYILFRKNKFKNEEKIVSTQTERVKLKPLTNKICICCLDFPWDVCINSWNKSGIIWKLSLT